MGQGWGGGQEGSTSVPGQHGLLFLSRGLTLAETGCFASGYLMGLASSYLLLIVFEGVAAGRISLLQILSSILNEETR